MKKRYLIYTYAALLIACSSTVEKQDKQKKEVSQNDSTPNPVEEKPPVYYLDQVNHNNKNGRHNH